MAPSDSRKRRSSSTKLPLFAPRSSFPPTPRMPTTLSPAIIGAMRKSPPAPPRNFETVTESGSREGITCFAGGSAGSRGGGPGVSNPKRVKMRAVKLVGEENNDPPRAVENRHAPMHQLLDQLVLRP